MRRLAFALFCWLSLLAPALAQAVVPVQMRDANLATTNVQNFISTQNTFTAPRTLTVPDRSSINSYYLQFIDTANAVNGANTLTIAATGGNLINGSATLVITNPGAYIFLTPSGTGYKATVAFSQSGPFAGIGGSNTQVQYNNAGVFGGISGATSNGTTLTLVAPILGTPASGVITNLTGTCTACTANTVTTNANLTGAVTSVGNATSLGSFSSANLRTALTDESGTGVAYFQGGDLGTPSAGVGTNITSLNATQLTSGTVPNARLNATITPQGRLTLVTGTPVQTGNTAAAGTMFYTPAVGNLIPLYDGTNWIPTAFTELSNINANSATGSAGPAAVANNSCYDYFGWSNAGTPTLTRGPAWTSTTARSAGTAISRLNGVLMNSVSITNGPASARGTYLGTACSNGTATFDWNVGGSASGGTAGQLMVWNYYNRVTASGIVIDSGASYTYTAGTVRQARASAGNQVTFVIGVQEDSISINNATRSQTLNVAAAAGATGVGLDSTTTYGCSASIFQTVAAVAQPVGNTNSCYWQVGIGQHFVAALESSDGGNANTYDHASNNTLSVAVRN